MPGVRDQRGIASGEVCTRPLPMFAPGELEKLSIEGYATSRGRYESVEVDAQKSQAALCNEVDAVFFALDETFTYVVASAGRPATTVEVEMPDRVWLGMAAIKCARATHHKDPSTWTRLASRWLADNAMNGLTQPLDLSYFGNFDRSFSSAEHKSSDREVETIVVFDFSDEPEWSLAKHKARKAVKHFYGLDDADSGIPEQ